MSIWRWKRLGAVTATLGVVASGLLGAGSGTALAGSNGQQISYYSQYANAQCTTGKNQIGENIKNCTQLQLGSNPSHDYWWVGSVSITWYRVNNSTAQSTCDVPLQQNGDFFDCYEPPAG
ncbi:MAG: hypothetical protein ACRDSZ_00400 [Pseudonocardiaceae bacterium]